MKKRLISTVFTISIASTTLAQGVTVAYEERAKRNAFISLMKDFKHDFNYVHISEIDSDVCESDSIVALGKASHAKVNLLCLNPNMIGLNKDFSIFHTRDDFKSGKEVIKKNLELAAENYSDIAFVYSLDTEKRVFDQCQAIKGKNVAAFRVSTPEQFAKTAGRLTSKAEAVVITANPEIVNAKMLRIAGRVLVKNNAPIFGGPTTAAIDNGALAGFYYEYHDTSQAINHWIESESLPLPSIVFKLNELLARYMGVSIQRPDE